MLSLRRFKITAVFVALAFLSIGAVWVYAATTHGYNDSVYWDVSVSSLYRYGDYTYSTHQYYIENDDTDESATLIEQEFKHRVVQTYDDGRPDAERISRRNSDMTDTVTIDSGASKHRTYRHKVDISSLDEGTYYINAYTRINLDGISESPTPKAEETSSDFDIDD